jgi:RNA polymerase-interacting CarD/CdnL/TRCF family regulator
MPVSNEAQTQSPGLSIYRPAIIMTFDVPKKKPTGSGLRQVMTFHRKSVMALFLCVSGSVRSPIILIILT